MIGAQGSGVNLAGIAGAMLSENGEGGLDFEHFYEEGETVPEDFAKFPAEPPTEAPTVLPARGSWRRRFRLPHLR